MGTQDTTAEGKVFLFGKGQGIGRKSFEIGHAERILELQKKVPPRVWSLDDPNYDYISGKLIKKTVKSGEALENGSNTEDTDS